MFGSTKTPSRSALSPTQALRLFDFYMKGTRTLDDDSDIVMELCLDADSVLSRIQRPTRKSLASMSAASSASNGDMGLHQGIGTAYNELARLFEQLGHSDDARRRDKKAEKWGYIQGNNNSSSNNSNNSTEQEINATSCSRSNKIVETIPEQRIATIAKDIFNHNEAPVVIRHTLPEPGVYLNDIHQLVYCLRLLSTASIPTNDLNDHEKEWRKAISNDQDEHERLCKLVSDVIEMFISNDTKTEAIVTEAVSLAPVLNQNQFRTLLMALVNGISQNIMLEAHLLEGLAQLMQHAPPEYLDSDDLVSILNTLSSRLQGTHTQSTEHLYRLSATVSHVLDAMVNSQVKGLKREQLHEPLAAYLKGLRDSTDPQLVYQAAYAFQALLYIPDDESTMQAMLRRTSAVLRGVFGVVSAAKGLDLNGFMDEISNIQKGLPSATEAFDMGLQVCEGTASLYESGAMFKQCMEEGLSFSRKSAWYPALRGADALLQTDEFIKFKTLVCEVPCRNDAAFQWGLCQRLGQIASDTKWAMDTRQDAITLLGEIYRNDQEWSNHAHIKQWIICILRRISSLSPNVLQVTTGLLNDLEVDGDIKKQELYRKYLQEPVIQHSFIVTLTPSTPSHLLDRAQKRPDVEDSLRQLKRQRIEVGNDQGFYIPQYAKASPQASDDEVFLLMDKVNHFLNSDQKVLLVQGDSGAGKSTFNRTLERTLWDAYQKGHGRIPLFINLPAIDKPEKQLVTKQLRDYGFTDPQIKELKMSRSFILICDGYDESMQTNNLYVANRLNQPGEWKAQMVISCRSEYLGLDYRDRFQPMSRNYQVDVVLFQEAVIVPFSEAQIDDYIEQYVDTMDPMWQVEDYQRALQMVPSLQDLVKNPFMLSMSLQVLPRMVDPDQDISNTKIKRVILYDQFVEQWLERGKKRLGETLRPEDRRMFHKLLDGGFAQHGIKYLTELAVAIYKHQDGNPVVEYSPYNDKGTWKERHFDKEDGRDLLREASPLNRTGSQHRFIHRSILEYSLVRAIFEPQLGTNASVKGEETKAATSTSRRQSIGSVFSFEGIDIKEDEQGIDAIKVDEMSPLVWRSFVDEPSILQFLEDRVQLEERFRQQLHMYVELSKSDSKWRIAAANAMTILIRAGESFNEADLRGIQIPGADLSRGLFEYAQLQGADLRKAKLQNCWLRGADLSGAKMAGIQFGEWPHLKVNGEGPRGSYSPDGKTLSAAIRDESQSFITVYDTSTWEKLWTLEVDELCNDLIYSPDSRYIASWRYYGDIVLVWDTTSGALIYKLIDHEQEIRCVVYSPSGDHLASAGKDGSVRVWDTYSGVLIHRLEGHTDVVSSLAYSPDGKQVAAGSFDGTLRVWDAASGQQMLLLEDHESDVWKIVYSPNGQEIVYGCYDTFFLHVWDVAFGQKRMVLTHVGYVKGIQYSPKGRFAASFTEQKVYQWDTQTGKLIHIFEGLTHITDLKYSPNGEQIAACSDDRTVWVWDTRSGQLINTFYGRAAIYRVAYSPNSHQIASFSRSDTICLWDARSQQSSHVLYGNLGPIHGIRVSPDGKQIASSNGDQTVRMWDAWTGQSIHVLQSDGYVSDIMYSADGLLLASRRFHSPWVYLWDTQTGQAVHYLELQGEQGDEICNGFAFSPIGDQIACVHGSGDVTIWDTQTGELTHTQQSNDEYFEYVAFSPNGRQIALCKSSGVLMVLSIESWSLQYEVESEGCSPFIGYSPDNRKIVFYYKFNGPLQLLNAETGERCYITESGQCAVFSPCYREMAYISGDEKDKITVIDLESGAELHTLEGHTHWIKEVSYSPDGKYIASRSYDKTVRVWDPETGHCLVEILPEGEDVEAFAWNTFEEDYFLITGCEDGTIRMWQIVQKNNQYKYRLKWSTNQTILNARNMCIQDVVGLSEVNSKLLVQRGAIGEHSLPLVIEEVSKQAVVTPLMTSESKVFSSQVNHQDPVERASDAVGLRERMRLTTTAAPSRSIKDYQFKYSMCNECGFAHVISCGLFNIKRASTNAFFRYEYIVLCESWCDMCVLITFGTTGQVYQHSTTIYNEK